MNKQEIINKIKESFKALLAPQDAPTESEMITGAIVSVDGSEIVDGTEVVFEDGTAVPDGDYEMADGSMLTVKDGKAVIAQYAPVEEPAQEDMTAPVVEDAPAEDQATESADNTELSDRVSALEDMVSQILEAMNMQSDATSVLMSKVDKIAETPATEAVKFSNTEKKVNDKVSDVEAELEKIRNLASNFRK